MTVSELIRELSELDPDTIVYVEGKESGLNDISDVIRTHVNREVFPKEEWWNGRHGRTTEKDKPLGIVLS